VLSAIKYIDIAILKSKTSDSETTNCRELKGNQGTEGFGVRTAHRWSEAKCTTQEDLAAVESHRRVGGLCG
jgi:hypothetical protein